MTLAKARTGASLRIAMNMIKPFDTCSQNYRTEALEWFGRKSLRTAYRTCNRGDWMMLLATRFNLERRRIVRATCACARLALIILPADELRPRMAVETADAWALGEREVGCVELTRAGYNADEYSTEAYDADEYTAAAAAAAQGAIHSVEDCGAAIFSVNNTAWACSRSAKEREEILSQCANIVRAHIPMDTFYAAVKTLKVSV